MKNRQTIISSLIVAMTLGTAWAIRGKFGHEQGAAWAGAVGGLAIILVSKRNDWNNLVFRIALASAFGWGIGGMISYGVVVGYGRGSDFGNVFYGLLMLFVIGALYGFLGGGFLGLSLSNSKSFTVKWHALLAEMVAFALLIYGFIINQLEWFMTPPRSELWAACLGAAIAVAWYILRNKQKAALKVAVWSALGAGFGFAFGNFLQVIGRGSTLPFNFWNIMEYSIGFFGGLGMAYGTLTSDWPIADRSQASRSNLVPMLLVCVFVPFVVWDQSFVADKLTLILKLGGSGDTIVWFQGIAAVAIVVTILIMFFRFYSASYSYDSVRMIFILYLGLYTFLSFLLTGIFVHPIEQYLYLVNIALILFALPHLKNNFEIREAKSGRWLVTLMLAIMIIALSAVIAIHSHGELKGSQIRFK